MSSDARRYWALSGVDDYLGRQPADPVGHQPSAEGAEADQPEADDKFEFDLALSFAGEDRQTVGVLAHALREAGVRVFYDEFQAAPLWGTDLLSSFDDTFRNKARHAAVFISHHYVTKAWTNHERQSILSRALVQPGYLLPVQLDNAELPGLTPNIGYIDARQHSSESLANLFLKKLGSIRPETEIPSIERVPRTLAERQRLLAFRPPGWEYFLYASELLRGQNELEEAYLDHQMRLIPLDGEVLDNEEAMSFVRSSTRGLEQVAGNVERVLSTVSMQQAFGDESAEPNPELIAHLARRTTDIYRGFLKWSAKVRSYAVDDKFGPLFELIAQLADQPIDDCRVFVAELVSALDQLPARMKEENDGPIGIEVTLTLRSMDVVLDAISAEVKRVNRLI